jgi:hypothetical protein
VFVLVAGRRARAQAEVLPRAGQARPRPHDTAVAAATSGTFGTFGPDLGAFLLCQSRAGRRDAENMNARFLHQAAGSDGGTARPEHERIEHTQDAVIASRADCCPARPVVRVIMPSTPARVHETGLLLCGHHYRVSRAALAKAHASACRLPGPAGIEPAALIPDLPRSRVPVR